MKRRPLLLAAVVMVAALACVVPWWWEIWLVVAYEKNESEGGVLFYSRRGVAVDDMKESDYFVPPQRCEGCREEMHLERCGGWTNYATGPHSHGFSVLDTKNPCHRYEYPAACTCPTCHPERER